jgi:hypothetical protein
MSTVTEPTFFNFATLGITAASNIESNTAQAPVKTQSPNADPQPDIILDIGSGGVGAGTRAYGFAG